MRPSARLVSCGLVFVASLFIVAPASAQESPQMSFYWLRWYFSDDSFQTQVGERSWLCTHTENWGDTSEYIYEEAGSCEPPEITSKQCCMDGNANGACGDPADMPTWCIVNSRADVLATHAACAAGSALPGKTGLARFVGAQSLRATGVEVTEPSTIPHWRGTNSFIRVERP